MFSAQSARILGEAGRPAGRDGAPRPYPEGSARAIGALGGRRRAGLETALSSGPTQPNRCPRSGRPPPTPPPYRDLPEAQHAGPNRS